jgi:hypothetical protein
MGYHFGISGKGNLSNNLILAFIFVVVMFLILALDSLEMGITGQSILRNKASPSYSLSK